MRTTQERRSLGELAKMASEAVVNCHHANLRRLGYTCDHCKFVRFKVAGYPVCDFWGEDDQPITLTDTRPCWNAPEETPCS